jgi:methyl-accepting chemotaxis protein
MIMKRVVSPLQQAVKALEAVAASNLEKTLDVHTGDEIGTMARALHTAMLAMRRPMG